MFAHCAWAAEDGRGLPDHPGYWRAKKRRDAGAALALIEDVRREEVLDALHDLWMDACPDERPLVVAPSMTLHESQNYLAIGHARWLAHEMGWEAETGIFQARTMSRDFKKDGWYRIAHEPEFYGRVQRGRTYVVADDVCTMGGTLAALRGFIESGGGRVMCMTALATRDGAHTKISLDGPMRVRLDVALDGGLQEFCRKELGHGCECLTEPEGGFLLRCTSIEQLRAGLDGARQP